MGQIMLSVDDSLKLKQILNSLNLFFDQKVEAGSKIETLLGSNDVQKMKDQIGRALDILEKAKEV